jgi:predicted enzyme related to lactoylglutathione lyase
MAGATTFYGGLFDWTFAPVQGAGDMAVEIMSRDLPIGTIRVADGAISGFNGVVYVQVNDLPASCKKAVALGGKMVPGFPFNLQERPGAIALLTDPSGHPIGMYSRTPLPAAK